MSPPCPAPTAELSAAIAGCPEQPVLCFTAEPYCPTSGELPKQTLTYFPGNITGAPTISYTALVYIASTAVLPSTELVVLNANRSVSCVGSSIEILESLDPEAPPLSTADLGATCSFNASSTTSFLTIKNLGFAPYTPGLSFALSSVEACNPPTFAPTSAPPPSTNMAAVAIGVVFGVFGAVALMAGFLNARPGRPPAAAAAAPPPVSVAGRGGTPHPSLKAN